MTAKEHLQIVERLEQHDADGAERISREQVWRALCAVQKMLDIQKEQTELSPTREHA
jgi:DNA-binding GntR family transcriptional regulator